MNDFSEILAPAGSRDAMRAAVFCGADAVYLGVKELNARRSAENFDIETLKEDVDFCHSRGVKVYLTLNTLVSDGELKTVKSLVTRSCEAGVDALILQDFAVAEIARNAAPDMAIHASTQMSVQSIYGINKLRDYGFTRAVIPRELSRDEIKYLCENSPIELEMFVHGALCMSVSGQCYMSAMLGSRSGNRGACAQPCRLPFSADNSLSYDLSLKDLSLTEHLKELSEMGVASFKIEGRMKRPEYVAAATTACRNALRGELNEEIRQDLKNIFSRSGFTDGYYENKLGKEMFGTRRKEDVISAAPTLKKLQKLYEKESPRFKADFYFSALRGEEVSLSVKSGSETVFEKSDFIPSDALNKPLLEESVKAQLMKTGGTQFFTGDTECEIDNGINVPVSVINSLRRNALSSLAEKMMKSEERVTKEYNPDFKRHFSSKTEIVCRFKSEEQIPDSLEGVAEIILPYDKIKTRYDAAAEIPRGIFGSGDKILSSLKELNKSGVGRAFAGTLDGMEIARKADMEIFAGYGSNIFNSLSLDVYERMGIKKALLSAELTLRQAGEIKGDLPRGIIAYGSLPLMLTRNCPVKNKKDCGKCKGKSSVTDRKNISFPVRCTNGCSEILNSKPLFMADRLDEIKNMDFILLYFTDETKEEAEKIISLYKSSGKPPADFTRGLLYRGVE